MLLYNEVYGDDFSLLNDHEYLVAEALLIRKELRIGEVQLARLRDVLRTSPGSQHRGGLRFA